MYLYAWGIDRFTEARTVRFIVDNDKMEARMWLNGVLLEHNARYALKPGDYVMLIEVKIDKPWDKEVTTIYEQFSINTHFVKSADDPMDDVKAYEAEIAEIRSYLEKVITLAPDSEQAKKASAILGH